MPAEAPPSVETDVGAKAGTVVEAKEGDAAAAVPPAEDAVVEAKEGEPTKE